MLSSNSLFQILIIFILLCSPFVSSITFTQEFGYSPSLKPKLRDTTEEFYENKETLLVY